MQIAEKDKFKISSLLIVSSRQSFLEDYKADFLRNTMVLLKFFFQCEEIFAKLKYFVYHVDYLHSVWECYTIYWYIFQAMYIILSSVIAMQVPTADAVQVPATDGTVEILELHQRMIAIRSMLTQQ